MDLDTSDPRAVAGELERLAGATHLGSATRKALAAGARTIRKLLGERVPAPPQDQPPPNRAI